jgi:SAM-dependent methyltransferase
LAELSDQIADRVSREKAAHDIDDVLAESRRLKGRFAQVFQAPHILRMEAAWNDRFSGVAGLNVLDYGCGRGELGLQLSANGAVVQGIDISDTYVTEANAAAVARGLSRGQAFFRTGDAHALPFENGSFDLVVGSGILHHLDIDAAVAEIFRVLKPGGLAVFKEPLVGGVWMRVFRWLTPRARTLDERPFDEAMLRRLDTAFHVRSSYYGLFLPPVAAGLSLLAPSRDFSGLFSLVDAFDQRLGRRKGMRAWHQYVLLALERPADATVADRMAAG